MAPRKQKRQDDIGARPQQVTHAPVAEAIAIGAAAGGLVLGTMQAQGAIPDGQEGVSIVPLSEATRSETHVAPAEAPAAEVAPVTNTAVAPVITTGQGAPAAQSTAVPEVQAVPDGADVPMLAVSVLAPVQSQLVTDLSEQMTAALVKVMGNAEPGLSPADLDLSLASDIIASAQDIVAKLDIGSLLADTQGPGDSIVAQVNAPGIVADVLGATSGIADEVLAEVADLPAMILGDAGLASLKDLPSTLLGNEGPDGSGGLLSEIFYADGASDSLDIPVLSDVAATLVSNLGAGDSGLLGLSYTDVSDHQGAHGLNALSLL